MIFDCELRFRDIVKKTSLSTGNDYFLVSFLDDNDNKYFFFYNLEDGKQFLNKKKYDLCKLHLYLTYDKNKNYKLGVQK